jgi:hypothetical protein
MLRKWILTSESLRVPQQWEAIALGEDRNKNGKRIPEMVRDSDNGKEGKEAQ